MRLPDSTFIRTPGSKFTGQPPESKADFSSADFDMQMFMATRGRERTLPEWHRLFDQSGLALEERVGLQSLGKILVLRRLVR
ncbi:MAG: hypothetical protein ACXWT1_18880 [Methylobacter sp.]